MSDFEPSDIEQYRTFKNFFVRANRPGSRPIDVPDDPVGAVVVTDSRVVAYDSVAKTKKLRIKDTYSTITNMFMSI
ncbi:phosphatidylserine decarboxylase [Daldinia childiae]|uniref:phosphatidylserine decarboxylase n=1 Tax=Daldinia childiae TaxID=326645 RepID=UPI001447A3D0|nr:phosphatidylserine decarboxylase [Daldinia childiae]KAF3065937.1 phosphatidylserine decarboxylase [Daldinia childiae]